MIGLPPEIQRISRLTPLAEALACVDRLVAPEAPRRLPLVKAVGFVLAEDIVNHDDQPAWSVALRDGLAVRADAPLDASAIEPDRRVGAGIEGRVGAKRKAVPQCNRPCGLVE